MDEITFYINKRADFIENALKTIKDKSNLFERPFETIFGAMLPMILWPNSKVLSALLFVAEALGYGPGLLGKIIDKGLGFNGTNVPSLSDDSLKNTATSVIDMLLGKLGMSAESMIYDLYQIKQSIEIHDLVAIAAYLKQNPNIIKTTYIRGPGFYSRRPILKRPEFLFNYIRGRHGRLGLINSLWWVLKTFTKGLIGLGIAGGVVGKAKEVFQPSIPSETGKGLEGLFPPSGRSKQLLMQRGPTDLYLNIKNNVEDTIIHFLDSQYKVRSKSGTEYIVFSEMFEKLNGYSLKNSGEMQDILKLIDGLNWGELEQINDKRTFVGPKLEFIAKKLLPVMQLESGVSSENKELLQALQGVYK